MLRTVRILLLLGIGLITTATDAQSQDYSIDIEPRVVGSSDVEVQVSTNIPGTIEAMLSLGLAGQKPDDVFIGISERITIRNGRASETIGERSLPSGQYEVEVSFYPRWGFKDDEARKTGISSTIRVQRTIELLGTGEAAHIAQSRQNGQRWVMGNVYGGTPWNRAYWIKRFGEPDEIAVTRLNPNIIKAYYFPSLDMTIFVNELRGQVSHWRTSRASE